MVGSRPFGAFVVLGIASRQNVYNATASHTQPTMTPTRLIAILASLISHSVAAFDFAAVAEQCAPGVPLRTIAAIVRVESAGNPYAINISYQTQQLPRQPRSLEQAVSIARELLSAGKNISVGLGQINSNNFDKLGVTVEQLFDPCTNLRAAQTVLGWSYAEALRHHPPGQRALQVALSYYNSGNARVGFANGYVGRVYAAAAK